MKSWENGIDCFGNKGKSTEDHIYPKSEGGTSKLINIQKLTKASNVVKDNNLSGNINGIDFRVLKKTSKEQEIYGEMQIKIGGKFVKVDAA